MTGVESTPAAPDAAVPAAVAIDSATARGSYGWLSWTVAVIFGLVYAYDLFEAISTAALVSTNIANTNDILGTEALAVPWGILIADLLLAPVCYAAAFLVGRQQGVLAKSLVFLLGLAVSASLNLSLEFGFITLVS